MSEEKGRYGGSEMQDRVRRGALVLDQVVPGWAKRVNLKTLKMSNGALCMLGQLFGTDVETSIGQEMHPELWRKSSGIMNDHCGYVTGSGMIPKLLGRLEGDIDWAGKDADTDDMGALSRACAGADNKCFWADEVVARLSEGDIDVPQEG